MTVKAFSGLPAKRAGDDIRFEPVPTLSERHCLRARMSAATGQPYEIFVSLPMCAPPPDGFPILYLLDANADFALTDQVMARLSRRPEATGVEPAIIVGIGYPQTDNYNQGRRHFDFTAGSTEDAFYDDTSYTFGGQDAFVAFIGEVLKPVIRDHFPVKEDHETILGHSLGGFFVAELAMKKPQLFSGYIAISPSIWWDPDEIFGHVLTRPAASRDPIRLFLAVGGWESDPAPWQRQETEELTLEQASLRLRRRMIENISRFSELCRKTCPDTIVLRTELIDDEDHSSIYVACLPKALRFALPAGGL